MSRKYTINLEVEDDNTVAITVRDWNKKVIEFQGPISKFFSTYFISKLNVPNGLTASELIELLKIYHKDSIMYVFNPEGDYDTVPMQGVESTSYGLLLRHD